MLSENHQKLILSTFFLLYSKFRKNIWNPDQFKMTTRFYQSDLTIELVFKIENFQKYNFQKKRIFRFLSKFRFLPKIRIDFQFSFLIKFFTTILNFFYHTFGFRNVYEKLETWEKIGFKEPLYFINWILQFNKKCSISKKIG